MKTFFVTLKNKRRGELTDSLLRTHVDYLKKLRREGHLPFCGPLMDNDRGIWILRANSEAHAIEMIKHDPFVEDKYYQAYDCCEMLEANDENNWLMESDQSKSNLSIEMKGKKV